MTIGKLVSAGFGALIALFMISCGSEGSSTKRDFGPEVKVYESSDPDMLLPTNSSSSNSTYVESNIFMTLLNNDPEDLSLYGWLAVSRPEIVVLTEGEFAGGMSLTFEIRPEAKWDNGSPVLASDFLFTIKAILNPKTNAHPLRPFFDYVGDIVVDPNNPRKFTIYSKDTYMLTESVSGYYVLPEYNYDPEQIMRKFTIRDMNSNDKRSALKNNDDIIRFAEQYNSEKFQRERDFISGCGPYKFDEWVTGDYIRLTKKENWWGDALADSISEFEAFPDEIYYEIINDQTTVISALKDESIDLARGLPYKQFKKLESNKGFTEKFDMHNPKFFAYNYLGLNTRIPKLSDVRVRKALAHCVDKQELINILMYGYAEPTNSMVHPSKEHYNRDLEGYEFSLDKANALLDEAGWVDTDGDGIRDKTIDGEVVPLRLQFKLPSGGKTGRNIGLFFKENLRAVGVDMFIVAKEWTVFLEENDRHEFEVIIGGWVGSPSMSDPKQIWHTESAVQGGSNYVGFGNAESDALIESIRYEPNDSIRTVKYKELQRVVHEDAPYIFLYAPKERIVTHHRYDDVKTYALRPGYKERSFKM